MDASEFLNLAKKSLGDRAWSADLVLRVGVDLAQSVNSLKNLSGKDKSELVCRTILKMLDDGEMAEKEHAEVSTGKATTKIPWEECRNIAKTLLPLSLELVVKASRGEFSFEKTVPCLPVDKVKERCLPLLSMLPQLPALPALSSFFQKKPVEVLSEVVSLQNMDPLSEVRDLVLRVEKMLKEAQALPEVKAFAQQQQQKLLVQETPKHPNPESCAVLLPGESQTHVEVLGAQ
jgi:hypothetical protein